MEAPEKIYLEKIYPDNGVLPNGLNYNQSPDDIEYTRTDAFVKKVEEFIYSALNDGIMGTANIEDFMRLLKKHIEK